MDNIFNISDKVTIKNFPRVQFGLVCRVLDNATYGVRYEVDGLPIYCEFAEAELDVYKKPEPTDHVGFIGYNPATDKFF